MNIVELEKALLSDPFSTDLRIRLADLYLEQTDYDQAITQYDIVLNQDHENEAALTGRSLCLERQEQKEEDAGDRRIRLVATGPENSRDTGNVTPLWKTDEKVRFSDIVGMTGLKKTIRLKVVEPFRNPGLFERFSKKTGDGILLYGPPGCGKTMMAKAIASECQAEFLSVDISGVLSMWHGESEQNLAGIFARARAAKPCVLFFDELDAIAVSRAKVQTQSARTLVNELLSQMDGLGKENSGIMILGATNMPWDIDSAAKRPGRFSRQVFVPPPDDEARRELLRLRLHGVPLEKTVDPAVIAGKTPGFSGADLDGLIENAKERAMLDMLDGDEDRVLRMSDFEEALEELSPTTVDWLRTAENLVKYGGAGSGYKDLALWLRKNRII